MSVGAHHRATARFTSGLAEELAGLAGLSFDALRARYRHLYRKAAPAGLSRDLIARLIAHRLQEQQLGKLDDDLARHMAKLARGQETRRRIKTGSVLVREHDGVSHEVVIVPGGFIWNGETHRSLSTLAKRITGTTWNGPRFFGLRQRQLAARAVS